MKEQLIDFERYIINKDGTIWSKHYKKMLGFMHKNGYIRCNLLCIDGKKRDFLAHRVIAHYFIPNPDNKPEVDHINTIRTDNRIENLRWATSSENSRNELTLKRNIEAQHNNIIYAYENGTLIGIWESENAAARDLGINQGSIHNCAKGKCKTYKGYIWSYVPL